MGKNIYKGSNWFTEEKAGRLDDEGDLYEGANWLNEEKAGRIDDDGNLHKGSNWFTEEKAGRIDEDGNIYKGSSWFTEEKVGRIDEDGNIYKGSNWFTEEKVGRVEDEDSSCFLSTACIEAEGLADDCEELKTLRRYRDRFVRLHPSGHALIREYYVVAPRIVKAIKQSDSSKEVFRAIYDSLVVPCVRMIKQGQNEAALRHYRSIVEKLKQNYLSVDH